MSMTEVNSENRIPEGRIQVRRAEESDLQELREIEEMCFGTPWSEQTLRDMLSGPLDMVWAAEGKTSSGKSGIMGYLNFRTIAGEGELMRIAVRPEAREQGIGHLLMEQMIRAGESLGIRDITLEVRVSNAPARKLYQRFGFQEEAIRKNYYDHPQEDAVIEWRRA